MRKFPPHIELPTRSTFQTNSPALLTFSHVEYTIASLFTIDFKHHPQLSKQILSSVSFDKLM